MKQLYSIARGYIVVAKSMESFKKDFTMSEKKPEPRSVEFPDVGHKGAEKEGTYHFQAKMNRAGNFFN